MKRVMLVMVACGSVTLLGACSSTDTMTSPSSDTVGSGNVATESRAVAGFNAVSVRGLAHLIVEQTGAESLQITADDNLLRLIQSEVVDGVLVLGFRPDTNVGTAQEVLYRVTAATLNGLSVSGVSRAEAFGIATEEFTTDVSGVSTAMLLGNAATHRLTVSGVSGLDAPNLESRYVFANASGPSRALIRVSHTLTADVSGFAIIEYLGDPVVTATHTGGGIIGGGIVRRAGP